MITKKIICVWIGTFEVETSLYQDYLSISYDDDDVTESAFGTDTGLGYYDEDFMESWWFNHLDLSTLIAYKDDLLDADYFFDSLIAELQTRDLSTRHSILFLFGETGAHPTNEMLFDYTGATKAGSPIEFVFKKEYEPQ